MLGSIFLSPHLKIQQDFSPHICIFKTNKELLLLTKKFLEILICQFHIKEEDYNLPKAVIASTIFLTEAIYAAVLKSVSYCFDVLKTSLKASFIIRFSFSSTS